MSVKLVEFQYQELIFISSQISQKEFRIENIFHRCKIMNFDLFLFLRKSWVEKSGKREEEGACEKRDILMKGIGVVVDKVVTQDLKWFLIITHHYPLSAPWATNQSRFFDKSKCCQHMLLTRWTCLVRNRLWRTAEQDTKAPPWSAGPAFPALYCSPYRWWDSHRQIAWYICTWAVIIWYVCTWAVITWYICTRVKANGGGDTKH